MLTWRSTLFCFSVHANKRPTSINCYYSETSDIIFCGMQGCKFASQSSYFIDLLLKLIDALPTQTQYFDGFWLFLYFYSAKLADDYYFSPIILRISICLILTEILVYFYRIVYFFHLKTDWQLLKFHNDV